MNQDNTRGPELQRSCRIQDFASPGVIMRERSFVRPQSIHAAVHHHQLRDNNKRRSMILANNTRGKPTLEIYRPPGVRVDGVQPTPQQQQQANKLNVHAKEFTMVRPNDIQTSRSSLQVNALYGAGALQHSRSSGSMLHAQLLQAGPPRAIAANQLGQSTPRVHFNLQPQPGSNGAAADRKRSPPLASHNGKTGLMMRPQALMPLKRSKSLTSADALASGMAALGLATDSGDLGAFSPDIQESIDKALEDPNRVCARTLMEVVGHVVGRAVESPRYALPAARRCIAVVEREQTETFLESLLNTCRQWYQERDKLLGQVVAGGRPRLMAFLSFLLEMYCQLRRRAIQGRGGAGGRDLLTLICRCCEDCIRQPVPSPSDTENLFFVLTYIGRDLETQLPNELEKLLSAVRDAFLNTSAAPSIRKTLLQLIELHASRWQLPGCAVLYYYPSSK